MQIGRLSSAFFIGLFLGFFFGATEPAYGSPYDRYGIELPPPAYDHKPKLPFFNLFLLTTDVDYACDPLQVKNDDDAIYLACTRTTRAEIKALQYNPYIPDEQKKLLKQRLIQYPNLCVMILPAPDVASPYPKLQELVRHERAHCNGLIHDGNGHNWYDVLGKKVG
jgi:hypothetical protein